ncbi:MAG: SDR family oxidoreductase [Novosphingobium sp.]|nr:SDR family oxidoreductase [Novosphingobium sp.]
MYLSRKEIFDSFSLEGKTAIVTGIGPGIGAHVAWAYGICGAKVVLAARSEQLSNEIADKIRGEGGQALAVKCDVGQKEDIEHLLAETRSAFGDVDVLFNNATAVNTRDAMFDQTDDDWLDCVNVNLLAPYRLSKAVIPAMKEKRSGSIINVLTTAGHLVLPPLLAYGATKAGLAHMTRYLAKECGPWGIRVNNLCPGTTTPEGSPASEATGAIAGTIPGVPMNRVGAAHEYLAVALLLASEAATYTTGMTFFVDGGRVNTMGGPAYSTPDGQRPGQ